VVHAPRRAGAPRRIRRAADAYDLVLLDPPYRDAPALGRELSQALPAVLAPAARVVTESDRRSPLQLDLPGRSRAPLRRHPDSHPPTWHLIPRIAVCPGSYDPITNGHLDVIARASQPVRRGGGRRRQHPVRKGKTLFETEERLGFIVEATGRRWATSARRPFDVLVVEFARRIGARSIVKDCARSATSSTRWR
jgi:hypothetical protein